MIQIKDKLDVQYAVKGNSFEHKEVDMSKRTVDLIANTYLFFDSDGDVLMPGCSAKSISERGASSDKPGKIKHLMNHDLKEMIAVPTLIEEAEIESKQVLHANSYFPESEDSENALINYQSGMYDQHSIGFRYIQLELAERDSTDTVIKRLWDETIQQLINPQDAEKNGYMFVVKEIALYEYSTLAFGANRLTPYLGVKSENKAIRYHNIVTKLDALLKSGGSDKFDYELQERQLKQMLYELINEEPFRKPLVKAGQKNTLDAVKYINNFNFKF